MPPKYQLRVSLQGENLQDGDDLAETKTQPMTAAERKQKSRQRKCAEMSDKDKDVYLKSERKRLQELRAKKRQTKEGQSNLSMQYKKWKDDSRKSMTRQKKQAVQAKDRIRKRKQSVQDLESVPAAEGSTNTHLDTPETYTAGHLSDSPSRQTRWRKKATALEALTPLSPSSKVAAVKTLITQSSPNTRQTFDAAGITPKKNVGENIVHNLQGAFQTLHRNDNETVAMKKNILQGVSGGEVSANSITRLFGVGRKLALVARKVRMDPLLQWRLSLKQEPRSSRLSDSVRNHVMQFYYDSDISRELPGKRDQMTIKSPIDGERVVISKKILEVTLSEAYNLYRKKFPDDVIGQRKFESLRPIDVFFAKAHHREICCCSYHTNVEFALKSLNQLAINAGGRALFLHAHELVDTTLCDRKMKCIIRDCPKCGCEIIDEKLPTLKCSPSCVKPSCQECPVKWQAYERQTSPSGAKKLGLVIKEDSVGELLKYIKKILAPFSLHRFLAGHQHAQYKLMAQNLAKEEILCIMDFAENYTMSLPKEVQSMHWVNIQATIFVIVLTRHARAELDGYESTSEDPHLVDEHHLFISSDYQHDSHMVEHCKSLLFQQLPFVPTRNIEFCDGASSQFKCITALAYLAKSEETFSNMSTIRFWWETSHGKHKADGAGGVIKKAAQMAVIRKEEIIRNSEEFWQYCCDNLQSVGQSSTFASRISNAKTVLRKFYYVQKDAVNRNVDVSGYKTVKGTRKLHEARSVGVKNLLLVRNTGCACSACLSDFPVLDECINAGFVEMLQQVSLVGKTDTENIDSHTNVEHVHVEQADHSPDEVDNLSYDFSGLLVSGSTAVIRSDEELTPYYLLRVVQTPHVLEKEEKDDYGNIYGVGSNVVSGHYFELVPRQESVYYVDNKKLVHVYIGCILPLVCPDLEDCGQKTIRGKKEKVYKITLAVQEELLSYLH